MAVNLQSTPIVNACNVRIGFYNANALIHSMDIDEAEVLTITFDAIALVNPPHPQVLRTQNPNVAAAVAPGNLASVSMAGGQTLLLYGSPGGHQQRIIFT